MALKKIKMWTDGACSGNPGKGGWCAILKYNNTDKIMSGSHKNTTNNKMEMLAVINGLKALTQPCEVSVISDSAYIVNAFKQKWINTWINNNWKNSQNKTVSNKELWQELIHLMTKHKVTFIKTKGHADDTNNNRCDKIARAEILKI